MSQSQFKLYSLGVAAENLTIGKRTLEVTPIEYLNFVDGELKSHPTDDTVKGLDADGGSIQSKVTTDNAITATWFPYESNRHTPPDIRRGERVLLWRFADQDKFWWTDAGLDRRYRKLETVTWVFNATEDESQQEDTFENCYVVEVSTHKGTMSLHTSKANGEKTLYTVQFNPKKGTFTLADDIGQVVFIDSMKHQIHLANADKSSFTLDRKSITAKCDDTLNLLASKTVNLTTQTLNIKAKDINIACDDAIKASATTVTANVSSTTTIDCPLIKLGKVTIDSSGKITCAGIESSAKIKTLSLTSIQPITAPNV